MTLQRAEGVASVHSTLQVVREVCISVVKREGMDRMLGDRTATTVEVAVATSSTAVSLFVCICKAIVSGR